MADEQPPDSNDKNTPAPKAEQQPKQQERHEPDKGDDKLGQPGLRALQEERDARKALEQQLAQMRYDQQTQMGKLAEAFGIAPEKTQGQDMVAELRDQMNGLVHDNLVFRVAAEHQIGDSDDVALLQATKDEASMRRLAARLASAAAASTAPRTPRPDLSQAASSTKTTMSPADEFAELLKQSRR